MTQYQRRDVWMVERWVESNIDRYTIGKFRISCFVLFFWWCWDFLYKILLFIYSSFLSIPRPSSIIWMQWNYLAQAIISNYEVGNWVKIMIMQAIGESTTTRSFYSRFVLCVKSFTSSRSLNWSQFTFDRNIDCKMLDLNWKFLDFINNIFTKTFLENF